MQKNSYFMSEIAQTIDAELKGDPNTQVFGVASLQNAKKGQISFLGGTRYQLVASSRYEKFLSTTMASAVILSPTHVDQCPVDKLVTENPYFAFLKLAALFEKKSKSSPGIHETVVIGTNCNVHPTASIGPNCTIGEGCCIGEDTNIEANTNIKDGVVVGKNCKVASSVVIYHDVSIGDRVVIHSGAVIGKEGFGIVRTPEGWKKIPHLGTVIIGNDVEIGANTTIDRGSLDNTVLENGVKLDNQIQIAHGVVIGENTVIAGCTGIAGSTHIGKNCMIGGAAGIADNVVICDNVILTAMAQVARSIHVPGVYSSGTSIQPQKIWRKNIARLHDLNNLAKRIKKLENAQHE